MLSKSMLAKVIILTQTSLAVVVCLCLAMLSFQSDNDAVTERYSETAVEIAVEAAAETVVDTTATKSQIKNIITDSHSTASETFPDGWYLSDGSRYYYLDGLPVTGNLLLNGVSMDFDSQGHWISSRLDVPYISQLPDMPSGCEVVSVTMMLNYAGVAVTKEEVADRLPYDFDPNYGFSGSLYDYGDYNSGGIIWPPALLNLVSGFAGTAVDLSGTSWAEVSSYIDAGKPVCIWFTENGLDHTVLLTGYSQSEVWTNDPLWDKDVPLEIDYFLSKWAQNGYRALSY